MTNQPNSTNQDFKLQAQYLVLEFYLARMSNILLNKQCYGDSFESNKKIHNFIIKDSVNVLKQLQGNLNFQNTVIACLRSFDICYEFDDDTSLDELNLKHVNFNSTQFINASFQYSNLENASFKYAYIEDCSFSNSNLTNVSFESANLIKSDFRGAELKNANFDGACLQDVNLFHVDLSKAVGLTLEQVLEASDWMTARYNSKLQEEVSNHLNKLLQENVKDKLEYFYNNQEKIFANKENLDENGFYVIDFDFLRNKPSTN